MRVYNYASFARAFEKGVSKPNMTKIAKALFKPIVDLDGVVNRNGNLYTINETYAKNWYQQITDIPENIKIAAGRPELVNSIGDYFMEEIIDTLVNQMQETEMYTALTSLILDSDLEKEQKDELMKLYNDNERPDFLGRAFLYAVVRNNLEKDPSIPEEPIDSDLRQFKELINKKYPKPKPITPPEEIEDDEIGYVRELYRVYGEVSGEVYARPEDLDAEPKLRKNFDRQRKDYYKAETIHRELRDTIRLDETEGFDLLKDEVYDGVIDTRDKDYDTGYDRLAAVMEHATGVSLSNNLKDRTLDWVGPGEKKGVCHMLVNDQRLRWMEDDDDDE